MNKNVMSDPKTCALCRKEYQPTSNRQKYCIECKREVNRQKCSERYRKTYVRKGYSQKGENNNNYVNGLGTYKEKAFSFYGKKCTECGSKKFICVHHRDEDRENNDITNLEVLCRSCHAKRHKLHKNFGSF